MYYAQERSGYIHDAGFGLIHIFYGQGAGKTSRAVGLAVRAAGHGLSVVFVQFMKSARSGEVAAFRKFPNIRYLCPGEHPFIMSKGPQEVHFKHARKALEYALEAAEGGAQLLICDEILDTIIFKVLRKEQILDLMKKCKGKTELVMTGREAPRELMDLADYATELLQIKHPYYTGARARKGIEF